MRLRNRRYADSAAPIRFRFDGREVAALPGESVAAALSAEGVLALRRTRSGEERGLWCGMGTCYECLVAIDGRAGQRACMVKAEAGMEVRSETPAGTQSDPLAPLAASPPAGTMAPAERECAVLVVGGGPAGLAAANAAARSLSAAGRGGGVVLLDERPDPGGQYFKPLAASHAFAGDRPADRQFAAGRARVAEARAAGVEIVSAATVWGAFAADELAALVEGRASLFRPARLVLAPGAYERAVPVPGWTLPGVMTTGAMQTLARAYRVAPGRRVLVAGNGPLNLQLAVELLEGGAEVAAVVERAPAIGPRRWRELAAMAATGLALAFDGLRYLARLRLAGVPVLWDAEVVAAEPGSDGRFAAARIAAPAGEVRIAADALALGCGFVPAAELGRTLGLAHRFVDRHLGYLAAETDEQGRSSDARVFVVGDGAELGGARVAEARGTLAGLAAAADLGGAPDAAAGRAARARFARAERFQRALWALFAAPPLDAGALGDDVTVCRCEEVTAGAVRAALAEGFAALGPLKRLTRAGMGRCQGRYCAATLARLAAAAGGRAPGPFVFFAPRQPVRPVPAAAIAFEKPEWRGYHEVPPPDYLKPLSRALPPGPGAAAPAHRCDVLVIGGGVIGTAIALAAARRGLDVLVAERDEINLQASGANAGSMHVQMLSFDFGPGAQKGGGPAAEMLRIAPRAVRMWQQLAQEAGEDLEIRLTGGLMVAETEADLRFLEAKIACERQFGIEAELLDGPALRRLAPALSPHLVGAELCPGEGKINPLRGTYVLMRLAQAAGARFLRGAHVRAIEREGAGFRADTAVGPVRAGRVVIAAGAWSARVGGLLGLKLPVMGAPLQMVVTEPAPPLIDHLLAHASRHLTLKQAAAGGLILGGAWPAAPDPASGGTRTERASIEGNLWVAQRVLPQIAGLHVIRAWAAMNVNVDGAPLLGPVPGAPGVFVAATANGYTLAPVVGELMADCLATGGVVSSDLAPFTFARFG